MADDLIETGDDLLDSSEEIVEKLAEDLPAGGVVSQAWSVALKPGRFGIKMATTGLSRGDSDD